MISLFLMGDITIGYLKIKLHKDNYMNHIKVFYMRKSISKCQINNTSNLFS